MSEDKDYSGDRRYESPSVELREKASRSSNVVLPGLVIGSLSQCQTAKAGGYATVCVRHIRCHVPECIHSAVLDLDTWIASEIEMERVSAVLNQVWKIEGRKTYVHCFHGIERAPLAVAYFIKKYVTPSIAFADVYQFVRQMRPVALDRTRWLEKVPS